MNGTNEYHKLDDHHQDHHDDHHTANDDPKTPLLPLNHNDTTNNQEASTSIIVSLSTPNTLCILLGPLLCGVISLWLKVGELDSSSRNMLGILAWMFTWWLTEAVPMPVTSMSPLFLFPMLGISSADAVAKTYMDDVISLVLGSFILALAVEHYNIHKRLALNITLLFCGDPVNPPLLLLGICATTAFVSMWMHNVAAAVMMMPVATGILQRLPTTTRTGQNDVVDKFCRAVVLGVIYSAAIGGMSTLTGTGVNLILAGMWKSYFPEASPISFNKWFFFGFPLAMIIFFLLWAILCCLYCKRGTSRVLTNYLDKNHLKTELDMLGPMSFAEKMVLFIFSVLMATLLFIIPNKKRKGEKLMDWSKCKKLPWNIVLLLGAGFAIAEGVRTSGLADELSKALDFLEAAPSWMITPAVCIIGGTITEFTSNNSTTTLLIPLLIQIAQTMHLHPILLMVPGAIGAQFAYLLPTGTPSNIVGFSTGHIDIKDMLKVGLPLKIGGTIALSLLMPTLGAYVFGTEKLVTYPLTWRSLHALS